MHKALEDRLAAYDAAGKALVARIRQEIVTQRHDWRQLPEACRRAERRLPEFRYCSAFGLWVIGRNKSGYGGLYIDCDQFDIVVVGGQSPYVDWQPWNRSGLDIIRARTDQVLEFTSDLERFDAKAAFNEVGPYWAPDPATRRAQRARGLTSRDLSYS